MSTEKMTLASVEKIISRMIVAAKAKNQQEMIEKTGLSDGIASKWRKRRNVPDSGILKVAQMTGVSFEWLKSGEGEMRPHPPDKGHGKVCDIGWLTEEQQHLLRLWDCADPISRSNALLILEQSASQSRENEGGGSN